MCIFYGFIGGLIFGRKKYGGFFMDFLRPEIRSGKIYGGYFMDFLVLIIEVFMGGPTNFIIAVNTMFYCLYVGRKTKSVQKTKS